MPQVYEEPKVVTNNGPLGGTTETHPSYAQIGAYRVSGQKYLYGSDFAHQHFIEIRIKRSSLDRGLSNDWAHANEELIEVALSEAQWATFVSSMNIGDGVQCTLQHVGREDIPQLFDVTNRQEQFQKEANETLQKSMDKLKELSRRIGETKLSGKQKDELLSILNSVSQNIGCNLDFVAEQFGEHMEKVTEHAKVEVNAYIQSAVARAGLAALTGAGPPLLLASPGAERTAKQ